MGSKKFYNTVISKSAKDGFNYLVKRAEQEYGHMEGYSGAINSAELGKCIKQFDKCTKTTEKQAEKLANEELRDYFAKNIASFINCGIVKMELVTVKNKRGNYTKPIYEDRYCLYTERDQLPHETHQIAKKETLEQANKYAIEYALKNCKDVSIRKEKTLVKGDNTVSEVIIERKEIKTLPKTLKSNQKIEKYYKFIFFGEASY